MGISSAMQTGVSGLRANSTAVGKISDNIANANTDGYKRGFAQMVTTTTGASSGVAAAGVNAVAGTDLRAEGPLKTTSQATDLAIVGPGFFVVSKNPNDPFEGNYMLTRAGSFAPDESGYLKNAAGYYLAGFPYGEGGTVGLVDRNSFTDLETVNLSSVEMTGAPTTQMTVKGNLPSQVTEEPTPGDPFLSSAEFYSPLGASDRLQFSWQATGSPNQWELTVSDSGGVPYGSVTVDFHDSGALAGAPLQYSNITDLSTAPAGFSFDAATGTASLMIDNGAAPQQIDISIGAPDSLNGMTQFAGDYSPPDIASDGSSVGTLVRAEVTEHGDVFGVFDNGSRVPIFSIPVADVTNPDGMIAVNGNAYLLSQSSGAFRLGEAGAGDLGVMVAGALEGSNVEIAQELTDLISTQRAYSSNAKIVTTVDEMLDETTRLKR